MASKFGTWRQKIQQHLFAAIGMMVLLIALLAFVLAVRWFGWNWTGFNSYFGPKLNYYQYYRADKTFWDWLQLLIIPFMLVVGGYWLNLLQRTRDERAAEERNKREGEIAADKQREAVLDAYLDRMAELDLTKKLHDSAEADAVRNVARARTMMALRRLDGTRKALVIRGLHDFGLIDKKTCIISLNGAQLHGVQLHGANLSEVNLSGADLFGAVFSEANLSGANLSEANLSYVNLSYANLSEANLSGVNLSGADLKGALGATLEELDKQAKSLKGATMPDGSKHP